MKDIHQCENTDHVYANYRTDPRATCVVRVGDLVPAGTMLVIPGFQQYVFSNVDFIQKVPDWSLTLFSRCFDRSMSKQ